MIESTLSEQHIMSMPVGDAVELMVMMAWMMRMAKDPAFKLSDARQLTLGEVLAAVDIAQNA